MSEQSQFFFFNNNNKIVPNIAVLTSHFPCIVRVLNQTSDEVGPAFHLDNHDAPFHSWQPSSRWKMKLLPAAEM